MKNNQTDSEQHPVVSSAEWIEKRIELLRKEKEFTKLREELTQARRELPWEKIEKDYAFESEKGKEALGDLFEDCSQLIVYHFMYGPDWEEGCKVCSMFADHYDPLVIHLRHRDVTLITASRAPISELEKYKDRMGWSFKWVSTLESDFNFDFQASLKTEDLEAGTAYYNYQTEVQFPTTETPGISSFYKDSEGNIYHTYSAYSRGLENFLGIYHLLDIVPKGRDEDDFTYSMEWIRHKDRYGDDSFVDPYL